jgi:HEPN domain-containing protein
MAENREMRQQELARLLLDKARQDFALVQAVGELDEIADEILGFHVQQTIEKAIKAALTRLGFQYQYTHDLSLLFQQAADAGANPPATLDAVEALAPFAVQFRYMIHTDLEFDRKDGANLARIFIDWADDLIEAPVQSVNGQAE